MPRNDSRGEIENQTKDNILLTKTVGKWAQSGVDPLKRGASDAVRGIPFFGPFLALAVDAVSDTAETLAGGVLSVFSFGMERAGVAIDKSTMEEARGEFRFDPNEAVEKTEQMPERAADEEPVPENEPGQDVAAVYGDCENAPMMKLMAEQIRASEAELVRTGAELAEAAEGFGSLPEERQSAIARHLFVREYDCQMKAFRGENQNQPGNVESFFRGTDLDGYNRALKLPADHEQVIRDYLSALSAPDLEKLLTDPASQEYQQLWDHVVEQASEELENEDRREPVPEEGPEADYYSRRPEQVYTDIERAPMMARMIAEINRSNREIRNALEEVDAAEGGFRGLDADRKGDIARHLYISRVDNVMRQERLEGSPDSQAERHLQGADDPELFNRLTNLSPAMENAMVAYLDAGTPEEIRAIMTDINSDAYDAFWDRMSEEFSALQRQEVRRDVHYAENGQNVFRDRQNPQEGYAQNENEPLNEQAPEQMEPEEQNQMAEEQRRQEEGTEAEPEAEKDMNIVREHRKVFQLNPGDVYGSCENQPAMAAMRDRIGVSAQKTAEAAAVLRSRNGFGDLPEDQQRGLAKHLYTQMLDQTMRMQRRNNYMKDGVEAPGAVEKLLRNMSQEEYNEASKMDPDTGNRIIEYLKLQSKEEVLAILEKPSGPDFRNFYMATGPRLPQAEQPQEDQRVQLRQQQRDQQREQQNPQAPALNVPGLHS